MADRFVTKDSGERQVFATGMQRDSGAKELEPGLIPIPMLVRWAELMGRGAAKYEARNWEKAQTAEELDRFQRSAFRHFVQWMRGDTDEDHAAAVFFNVSGAEHVRARLAEETLAGFLPTEADTSLDAQAAAVVAPRAPKLGDRVRVREGSKSSYVKMFEGCFGEIKESEDPYWLVLLDGEHDAAAFLPDELEPLNPSGAV